MRDSDCKALSSGTEILNGKEVAYAMVSILKFLSASEMRRSLQP
jgi:hypothetical protein